MNNICLMIQLTNLFLHSIFIQKFYKTAVYKFFEFFYDQIFLMTDGFDSLEIIIYQTPKMK